MGQLMPLLFPICAAEPLKHFPNAYIEVAEFDCLRDEGIAFAERLRSDGVFTELHKVKGACHGFEAALESRIAEKSMQRRIHWLLMKRNYSVEGWGNLR